MNQTDRLIPTLLVVSGLMLTASPYVIDTAPYESTMGLVQRIFYYHFPMAMNMMLAAVTFGIGVWLEDRIGQRQEQRWEFFAAAGCLFITFAFPGFVWRYLRKTGT